MAVSDKIVNAVIQAIAAATVIATNSQSIKAEIAPIKAEQVVVNGKIEALTEKVVRIEKKVGE